MQVVLSLTRCCREVRSQLMSMDCQLIFLGKKKKSFLHLMGLISTPALLIVTHFLYFPINAIIQILIRSGTRHVTISRNHNEALTLATEVRAKSETTNNKSAVHRSILINLVETNRNLHWPCFLDYTLTVSYITKPISGMPRFISMFGVITE